MNSTNFEQRQSPSPMDAREERLFEQHRGLARKLARRYRQTTVPLEDLEQVACIGLLLAVKRYDPERGRSLASFAIPTILGEIKRHLRDNSRTVHVTRGAQESSARVRSARDELMSREGRAPSVQQLAQYMECDIEEVIDGLFALNAYDIKPFDQPATGEPDGLTFADTIGAADEGFELAEDRIALQRAMPELSDREREVLRLRFVAEQTQSKVAEQLGCSQMQVSRIQSNAIRKLRETICA